MNLPPTACALALAAAAIVAAFVASHARPTVRDYIRFSASLYAGLSLAEFAAVANAAPLARLAADCVALLVMTLAPQALALAVRSRFGRKSGPLFSAALLLASCAGGVIAAATGFAGVAIAGLLIASSMMLISAFRARQTETIEAGYAAVSALAFLAGAAAFMSDRTENLSAFALFSAAGLMGIAWTCTSPSHVAVERLPLPDRSASRISRAR